MEKILTSANAKKGTSPNGSGSSVATIDPWEQSQSDKTNGQDKLAASKRAKGEAEHARQNVANEILETAKTVCGELIADAERTLEKARNLESESDQRHAEAHEDRELAADIRREAEEYRDSLIKDAKRQSAEHIERSRAAAERECSEMKQRAFTDSEKMLAHAQVMLAAAQEELEAQQIYAEAARFKAASQQTLDQARNRLGNYRTWDPGAQEPTQEPTSAPEPATNGVSDPGTDPAGHQGQIDGATAIVLGTINIGPPPETADAPTDALEILEGLRNMQEAASKAVDAALAEERKPAKPRRTTKRKKTNT